MTRDELIFITSAAQLADEAARADYQAFHSTGKRSPMIKAVRDFQSAEGQLTPDGKWGPNAGAAARFYLNRPVTPPIWSPNAEITWHPPTEESEQKIAEQQHVKPTPRKQEVVTRKKTPPPQKPARKFSKEQIAADRAAPDVQQQLIKAANLDMPEHGQDQALKTNTYDVEDAIAKALSKRNKKTDAQLAEIQKLLKQQALSKKATHEHKTIVKKDGFEKDIKTGLAQIVKLLKRMPDKHPQKQKVAQIGRRFLGLLLT